MAMSDIDEILGFWEANVDELPLEEILMFYPGARAVARKVNKDFNLQIEIPSYCYELIGLLSKGNFAFGILLFVDILEYLSKDKKIPKGYKITPEDFKNTFAAGYPSWDDPEANKRYKEKWYKQKDYSLNGSDNKVDYKEYWEDYFE